MKKFVSPAAYTVLVLVGLMLIAHSSPQVSGSPVSSASENQIYFTSNAPSSQENGNLPVMTSQQDSYLVRTYDGKIGTSKNEEKSPFKIIDMDVSSLPQTDQLLLIVGIEVDSIAELQRIRKDYESQTGSPMIRNFPQKSLELHTRLGMGFRYTTEVYFIFYS